jgi:hypothetical protein
LKIKDEHEFLARGAKDYYRAASAVSAFQDVVLKTLREVTDEADSELAKLGLRFGKAIEKSNLYNYTWVLRKILRAHLEVGIALQWDDPDDPETEQPLCIYWWIWLRDRANRDKLASRLRAATNKPFKWEHKSATSYVSRYFPYSQSARIKEHANDCTAEFVRVMAGSRSLLRGPNKS